MSSPGAYPSSSRMYRRTKSTSDMLAGDNTGTVTQNPFLTEEVLGDEACFGEANADSEDDDDFLLVASQQTRRRFSQRESCGAETKERWRADVSAGVTVGVVLIPQGMAYGMLAGLNPAYGLYCGVVPLFVYSLLGDSPYLALGPFALVSLLTAEASKQTCKTTGCEISPDSHCYVSATLTLSLAVGIVQLIFAASGVAEVVASMLADSVMDGFTTAAACLITTSQIFHLVGFDEEVKEEAMKQAEDLVPVLTYSNFLKEWLAVFASTRKFDWAAVSVGALSTAALVAFRIGKQRNVVPRRVPDQLIVILLATGISAATGGALGFPTVGKLPSGFPPFDSAPWSRLFANAHNPLATLGALAKSSVTLAVLAYLLSLAVVRSLGAKAGQKGDASRPRRELAAMGAANTVGAFFSAYPAAGSLSRSALAAAAGAKTPRHNFVAAVVVATTLLALTPLFAPTPTAVLSAVVFVSLLSLFDFGEPRRLWRRGHKEDAVLWMVALFATLVFGVEPGLGISIVASIACLVRDAARPPVAQLGRIEGHPNIYRDLKRRKHAPQLPAAEIRGVVVIRYGAAVTFASKAHFSQALKRHLSSSNNLKAVVVDCSSITSIDSSGEKTLRELLADFKAAKITLLFACARSTLRDILANTNVLKDELIPASHLFASLHDAVSFAENNIVPSTHSSPSSPSSFPAAMLSPSSRSDGSPVSPSNSPRSRRTEQQPWEREDEKGEEFNGSSGSSSPWRRRRSSNGSGPATTELPVVKFHSLPSSSQQQHHHHHQQQQHHENANEEEAVRKLEEGG